MSLDSGQPLFKEPVSEWTDHKLYFVSWLNFYGKIYAIPDGPPEHIIENDAQLDKWIYEYNIKQRAKNRPSGGAKGAKKSASDHKHVISFKGD